MLKKTRKTKSKKLRPKKSNFSHKIYYFLAAVVVAGIYLLYRSLFLSNPIQIAQITNSNGTVSLALSPIANDLNLNQDTTVNLTYDAQSDGISIIQAELTFDPTLVQISNIQPSSKFPTQLVTGRVDGNKIIFTYGVGAPQPPDFASTVATGQGVIATFKAKALKAGDASIGISANTMVLTSSGGDQNSLKEITNTTLAITDPSASVAVSPSPSPCPSAGAAVSPSPSASTAVSPSPSASAAVSPSPAVSPSLEPSAPIVAKPDSPSNLQYNCYAGGTRITLRWNSVANANNYEVVFNQKDGDNDQTKTSSKAEVDLEIKSNTVYDWQVVSLKDGTKSDASTVKDIKCNGDVAQANTSPSPSPSPSANPSVAPSKKPLTQKVAEIFKKSPTPKPSASPSPKITAFASTSPSPATITIDPSPVGGLNDIFGSPTASPRPSDFKEPGLLRKILLGWQAFFARISELF